jgi:hypothetical protein
MPGATWDGDGLPHSGKGATRWRLWAGHPPTSEGTLRAAPASGTTSFRGTREARGSGDLPRHREVHPWPAGERGRCDAELAARGGSSRPTPGPRWRAGPPHDLGAAHLVSAQASEVGEAWDWSHEGGPCRCLGTPPAEARPSRRERPRCATCWGWEGMAAGPRWPRAGLGTKRRRYHEVARRFTWNRRPSAHTAVHRASGRATGGHCSRCAPGRPPPFVSGGDGGFTWNPGGRRAPLAPASPSHRGRGLAGDAGGSMRPRRRRCGADSEVDPLPSLTCCFPGLPCWQALTRGHPTTLRPSSP